MSHGLEKEISIRSVLKFTLPSIAMMVVMSLYTIVDGIFVSRLINTDAFSAVNIVYPLFSVVIALGTMFGTGLTAIVSKKIGEGKAQEGRENVTFIVFFTIGLGVALSLFCFAFLERIIYALGANAAIFDYCYAYAFPLVFFLPANILQLQFQCLFVANGKPALGLITTLLGGIANIVLDYVFIAIFHWGIAGAAIATGIGYVIPSLYGLFYFTWNRRGTIYFVKPKKDRQVLLHTMTNGSSEMVNNLSGSVTTFLFNKIMMVYMGPKGVAAISILLYLDFVLIAISLGYSMGIAPLISFNYGCQNKKRLKALFRLSVWFCVILGILVTIGTKIFAAQLTGIFVSRGTAVFELAVMGLGIYAWSYLFKCFNIFASAMFTAFSDGKVSALLSFLRTLVFLSGSLLGLTALFGLNGVWVATPVAEVLALILSVYCVRKYRWKYAYL